MIETAVIICMRFQCRNFFSFVEDQNLSFACSCIQIERSIVYKSLSLPNIGLFAEEIEQEDTERRQKHLISNNKVRVFFFTRHRLIKVDLTTAARLCSCFGSKSIQGAFFHSAMSQQHSVCS